MFAFISRLFGKAKSEVATVKQDVKQEVLLLQNKVENDLTRLERKTVASILAELRKLEADLRRVKNVAAQDVDEFNGKIVGLFQQKAVAEAEANAAVNTAAQIATLTSSTMTPTAPHVSPGA